MSINEITTTELSNKFDHLSKNVDGLSVRFDELMEFLQEHAATKEDLKAFATKDDLKAFATREDLKRELALQKMDIIDRMDDKMFDLKNSLVQRFSLKPI